MAMKLYPPIIEGALPAFFGTDTLSVPFSMNRAVGASEVAGFYLKIKTVSGSFIATLYSEDFDNLDEMYVNFNIRENNIYKLFNVGQYYKVQLAYVNVQGEPGYYSTVGVIKYTTEPTVTIENFVFGQINQHNYDYVGIYSQGKHKDLLTGETVSRDTTEKMYSSRFVIYNDDGSIFADSGEIIHKTQNDSVSYESHESFIFAQDLDINRNYYIRFEVKTTNGLEVSSPKYRVIQRRSVSPDIDVKLNAELDYDNGHIKLSIINNPVKNPIISGAFLVSRASSKNGYVWEEFKRFDVQSIVPEDWGAVDCTIEQGATYKYSLQQYNENGVYSDRIISNSVFADFEDAFLYDGTKQLKIRFNPKVSSFRNSVLETKVDTIGSQHPYIVRNGNVNYKDFPVSGLISYHMDDTNMFMSKEELNMIKDDSNYNLTGENITAERLFKLAALDWLSNGKPKLFRSPTEGNYIVRLMNVSLTPTDSVGRMLHTFSATAYEIAKFTTENLNYYGLIDTTENFTTQTRWVTVDLYQESQTAAVKEKSDDDFVQLNTRYVYSISFADMFPGTIIYIDDLSVMIGATGAYRLNSEEPIESIRIRKRDMTQGLFTYSYRSKAVNVFNLIERVHVEDVPCQQYIGEYPRVIYYDNAKAPLQDIFNMIEDVRTEVLHVAFIRFTKRDVLDVYVNTTYEEYQKTGSFEGKFFYDMDCHNPIPYEEMDKMAIYHLRHKRSDYRYYHNNNPEEFDEPANNEDYIVDRTKEYFSPYMDYYYDPTTMRTQRITPELFDIIIDDEEINIFETGKYVLKAIDDTYRPTIKVNGGIITEISYAKQIITYSMENISQSKVYPNLYREKINYETQYNSFLEAISKGLKLDNYIAGVKSAYNLYVGELEKAIKKYKEDNGIA